MRQLRKPTEARRATVGLQLTEIVEAEPSAPPGAIRRVRIVTPSAPRVLLTIDSPTPLTMGPGRDYMAVPVPPGVVLPIYLQPTQQVFAVVEAGTGGMATLGVFVEYFDEEAPA